MPAYEVDVEGVTYDVDAPDPDTAWVWANQFHVERATPVVPPREEEPSGLANLGSAIASGAGKILPTAVKGVADLTSMATAGKYGADLSQSMDELSQSVEDYWRTKDLARQSQEFGKIWESKDKGVGDAVGYLLDNPALLVEKGIETTGSMILPVSTVGAVGKVGTAMGVAAPKLAKALTATTLGTTAAQNAASTFNSEELKGASLEERYAAASVSAAVSVLTGLVVGGGAEAKIAKKLLGDIELGKSGALSKASEFIKSKLNADTREAIKEFGVGKIARPLIGGTKTGITEGLQEAGEEAGAILGEIVGGGTPTPESIPKRLGVSGLLGAVVGAPIGAVTAPPRPEVPPPPGDTGTNPEVANLIALGIDPDIAARIIGGQTAPTTAPPTPAEEEAPTAPARLTLPELDAARVAEIEQELIDSGIAPDEAKYYAAVRARREKAFASQAQAPAQVAGEPVGGGVGVSPTVPVPATEPPTTGAVEEPERLGMVRAGEAVGEISGATGPEPTALTDVAPKEGAAALYRTAKGSVYHAFPDGSTTRVKSYHPEHGPEDVGEKERSTKTVYIDKDSLGLNPVGIDWGDRKWRMVDHGDNTLSLVSQNPTTKQWGRDEFGANVPYSTEPAVGLTPVELWKPAKPDDSIRRVNTVKEAYRGVHFGNKITEVLPVTPKAAPAPMEQVSQMVSLPAQESINVEGVERPTTDSTGQRIHPTEEGVRSFWEGFKDTKAVDEQGRPLVMYHGTTADIDTFKPKYGAIFLSPDPKFASQFAMGNMAWDEESTTPTPKGANVLPVYAAVRNPFDLNNPKHVSAVSKLLDPRYRRWFKAKVEEGGEANWRTIETVMSAVQDAGFDSAYITERGRTNLAVFNPEQVKSAIGNRGAFDVTKGDIREQQGESVVEDPNNPDLFPYLQDFNSAIKAILKYATNPAQKQIARTIMRRIPALEQAGFEFSLAVTPEGHMISSGAMGVSRYKFKALGAGKSTIEITLNHPSNGKQRGTQWDTVAHELLHAITQAQIKFAPKGSAALRLKSLFNDVVKYFNARAKAGTLTDFEQRIYNNRTNVLDTPDELLAWGLSDVEAQKWLDSIKSKNGTFLSRLFDVVAAALGFTKTDTALAELLHISEDLTTEALDAYVAEANRRGFSFGVQENLTEYPTWVLTAAEGAPVAWYQDDAALIRATSIMGKDILLLATPKGVSHVDVGNYTGNMLPPARLAEIKQIAKDIKEGKVSEQRVAPPTPRQRMSDVQTQQEAQAAAPLAAAAQEEEDYAARAYAQSDRVETIARNTELLVRLRKSSQWGPALKAIFDASKYRGLDALVTQVPTTLLMDLATTHPELQELKRTQSLMSQMEGRTAQMLTGGVDLYNNLRKLTEGKLKTFNETSLRSTIAGVDPRTSDENPGLNRLYRELGENGQEAYGRIVDYYEAMSNYLLQVLITNIESLDASPAERDAMLAQVTEAFRPENRIRPYLPLTRNQDGPFWLQVGRGPGSEFYTFNSIMARDEVAKELAASQNASVAELEEDGEFRRGNDLQDLRNRMLEPKDSLLRRIFDMVDSGGEPNEDFKDAVFQMWLQLQPESSLLKNFSRRKKYPPAGFQTDVLNNLKASIVAFSTQIPRLQYAPQIRQSVRQARAAISGNPDLTPYVTEVDKRVEGSLKPSASTAFDKFATAMNSSTFSYFMSASTAALQVLGAYQTGVPQLLKNHTFGEVTAELTKLMGVFAKTGVSDSRGNWRMPSIADVDAITPRDTDTPEQAARKAEDKLLIQAMKDRNTVEATAARDILNFNTVPTELLNSAGQKAIRAYDMAVGGLIHHTERISREMIYMASARLARNKLLRTYRDSAAYNALPEADRTAAEHAFISSQIDRIADQADKDVNESLFDYSKFGKPRYMNAPLGRMAFQFFNYQLNAFLFMGRNLIGMVKPFGTDTQRGCFRAFTAAMFNTWVTSGALGLFLTPAIFSMLAAFFDWEDKDKPAELKNLDLKLWVTNEGLPELFAPLEVFGEKVPEAVAKIAADGPLNWVSGTDVASRTSLSGLGTLREESLNFNSPEAFTSSALVWLGGPWIAAWTSRFKGMQDIADGDIYKGAEQMLPALIRNPMQAARYSIEGETTKDGKTVLAPSGFTVMSILLKTTGFSPVTLADIKKATREAVKIDQKIVDEKNSILDELDTAFRKSDGKRYNKALESMQKFNFRYSLLIPEYMITPDMVVDKIQRRATERATSSRGARVREENIFFMSQILAPSRRAAAEAEAEGRK